MDIQTLIIMPDVPSRRCQPCGCRRRWDQRDHAHCPGARAAGSSSPAPLRPAETPAPPVQGRPPAPAAPASTPGQAAIPCAEPRLESPPSRRLGGRT
jgi:hypothetical protein